MEWLRSLSAKSTSTSHSSSKCYHRERLLRRWWMPPCVADRLTRRLDFAVRDIEPLDRLLRRPRSPRSLSASATMLVSLSLWFRSVTFTPPRKFAIVIPTRAKGSRWLAVTLPCKLSVRRLLAAHCHSHLSKLASTEVSRGSARQANLRAAENNSVNSSPRCRPGT